MLDKKKYYKEYYKQNKEKYKVSVKKYQQSKKGKQKIKEYQKEYRKRPDVRKNIRTNDKKRYWKDNQNKIYKQINKQIRLCIKVYCRDGKINISDPVFNKYKIIYGIDLYKLIDYLAPISFENYELDHIIPIKEFDLTKREEIKKAYNKNNLQLLSRSENSKKGYTFNVAFV